MENNSKASISRMLSGEPMDMTSMPGPSPKGNGGRFKKDRDPGAAHRSINSTSQAPPNRPQIVTKAKKRIKLNPQDILSAKRK